MNSFLKSVTVAAVVGLVATAANATPSSLVNSNLTHVLQSPGILHLTYDTVPAYGTPPQAGVVDYGLTYGWQLPGRFQLEAGIDFIPGSTNGGLQLNAKVGQEENTGLPFGLGWSAGIFGYGFEADKTDYNVMHVEVGKTVNYGTISVGYFSGKKERLGDEGSGFGIGFVSPDMPGWGPFRKTSFVADYQSGKTSISGYSLGINHYINSKVSLMTGVYIPPVEVNSSSALTIQLDVDF